MTRMSVSRSSRCVAKLCRSVCGETRFLIPAASAAAWTARLNWRVESGSDPDPHPYKGHHDHPRRVDCDGQRDERQAPGPACAFQQILHPSRNSAVGESGRQPRPGNRNSALDQAFTRDLVCSSSNYSEDIR
jgi:hypothetical protein